MTLLHVITVDLIKCVANKAFEIFFYYTVTL